MRSHSARAAAAVLAITLLAACKSTTASTPAPTSAAAAAMSASVAGPASSQVPPSSPVVSSAASDSAAQSSLASSSEPVMSSAAQSAPASSAPSSAPAVTTAASTTPPSPTGTATSASQTSPTASASGATASIGSFTSRISVILKFSAVDDQVSLNVNGADIVVSGIVIETQPALVADLTPYLRVGANAVRVTGYNKTYLATLKGTLSVDTKVVKAWNLHSGDQKTFLDNTFTVNYQPAGTAVTPAAAVDLGAVKAASVKFAQIDDLLNVSVNGVQVLTHGLVRMNGGDVSLDLTPYLKAGTNQIRIIAINELGSGALIGSVTADGKVVKTYKIGGDSRYHHRPFVDDTYTLTH